jgi:hypothetical protein
MLQIREEDTDFALSRLKRVAAVNEILGKEDSQVATDGARRSTARVGGAHHGADDFPCILRTFDHHGDGRAAAHELDELAVEALANVLFVVTRERVRVELTELHRNDVEVLGFEAGDDLTHELALHGVGLEENECAIRHGPRRYRCCLHRALGRWPTCRRIWTG